MIDYYTLEKHQKLEQLLLQNFDAKKRTDEFYALQAATGKKTKSQVIMTVVSFLILFVG
jgi:hypothetical protein